MRTNALDEIADLEPLPVFDDEGIEHAPTAAMLDVHVPHVLEPWTNYDPRPEREAARGSKLSASFMRMVPIDARDFVALPAWWHARAGPDGFVHPTSRLSLAAPRARAHADTWCARGRLRTVPVDLLLWHHLEGWSKLTLDPLRRVHATPLYFRTGHRALDVLTKWLVADLGTRPA